MEELVKLAKQGDKEAFSEIIYMIKNDLLKIAKIRLTCEDDINEAVQETIIATYKSIKKLKRNEYFKTWIIKILINKCNKIYKMNSKNNAYYENIDLDTYITSDENERIDSNIDFYKIVSNLNYDERMAVILYYMENYTTKDISKILKVSENTIKSRLLRARSKLKELYKEEV